MAGRYHIKVIIMANDRHIGSPADYNKHFPHRKRAVTGGDKAERAALDKAWEIRNFEIELYWKRALYFWAFVAAAGTGYGALVLKSEDLNDAITADLLSLAVASVGLVCSFAWYLVNRASKYWQENWERHVGALEDKIMGPLYKTTLAKGCLSCLHPVSGHHFSISKINIMVSLFITVIWCALFLWTLDGLCYIWANWPHCIDSMQEIACAIAIFVLVFTIFRCVYIKILKFFDRKYREGFASKVWEAIKNISAMLIMVVPFTLVYMVHRKHELDADSTIALLILAATIVAICFMCLAVGGFQKSDAWEIKFVHVDVTDSGGR